VITITPTSQIGYGKLMASSNKTACIDMQQFIDLAIRFEVESADFYTRTGTAVAEKDVQETPGDSGSPGERACPYSQGKLGAERQQQRVLRRRRQ
jgi:hypothetical protein